MPRRGTGGYYAVRNGYEAKISTSWADCEAQVKGYSGAEFKKFDTYKAAQNYMSGGSSRSSGQNGGGGRSSGQSGSGGGGHYSYTAPAPTSRSAQGSRDDSGDSYYYSAPVSSSSSSKSSTKPPKTQVVYTDGSARSNGRSSAKGGVGAFFGHDDPRNVSEPLPGEAQTNQRAELQAVIRALENADKTQDLEIRADSKYTIKSVNEWIPKRKQNNWTAADQQPVKNRDLMERMDSLIKERTGRTTMTHVKGHSGDPGNTQADRMAVAGSRKNTRDP